MMSYLKSREKMCNTCPYNPNRPSSKIVETKGSEPVDVIQRLKDTVSKERFDKTMLISSEDVMKNKIKPEIVSIYTKTELGRDKEKECKIIDMNKIYNEILKEAKEENKTVCHEDSYRVEPGEFRWCKGFELYNVINKKEDEV